MSAKSLKNPDYYSKVIKNIISSTELDSLRRLDRVEETEELEDIVEKEEEDKKEI